MARSTHHPAYQLFLDELRTARKATGWTQVELAEHIGNLQVFVSKIERGDRRMDIIDLYEYCEATGIDFAAFCTRLKRKIRAAMGKGEIGKLAIRPKKRRSRSRR